MRYWRRCASRSCLCRCKGQNDRGNQRSNAEGGASAPFKRTRAVCAGDTSACYTADQMMDVGVQPQGPRGPAVQVHRAAPDTRTARSPNTVSNDQPDAAQYEISFSILLGQTQAICMASSLSPLRISIMLASMQARMQLATDFNGSSTLDAICCKVHGICCIYDRRCITTSNNGLSVYFRST